MTGEEGAGPSAVWPRDGCSAAAGFNNGLRDVSPFPFENCDD